MRTALSWSLVAMTIVAGPLVASAQNGAAPPNPPAQPASNPPVAEAPAAEPPAEAPAPSAAPPEQTAVAPNEEARIRFELGNTLYDQGRFAEALDQFRAAHEVSGNAQMLHNMYLCERDAGNLRAAARYLERYLHEEPSVPNRPLLEGRLEGLQLQIEEQAQREAQASAVPPRQAPSRVGPILFFSIGGAALLAAGGLAANVASLNGDLKNECFGNFCPERFDDDRATLRRRAIAVDSLWVGALAIAAVGAIWWIVGSAGADERTALSCGPTGCTLEGSF